MSEDRKAMFERNSLGCILVELDLIITGETNHWLIVDVDRLDVFSLSRFDDFAIEVKLLLHASWREIIKVMKWYLVKL